jgi:hypothetical protein
MPRRTGSPLVPPLRRGAEPRDGLQVVGAVAGGDGLSGYFGVGFPGQCGFWRFADDLDRRQDLRAARFKVDNLGKDRKGKQQRGSNGHGNARRTSRRWTKNGHVGSKAQGRGPRATQEMINRRRGSERERWSLGTEAASIARRVQDQSNRSDARRPVPGADAGPSAGLQRAATAQQERNSRRLRPYAAWESSDPTSRQTMRGQSTSARSRCTSPPGTWRHCPRGTPICG